MKKSNLLIIGLTGLTLFNPITTKASDYIAKNEPSSNNTQYGVSIAANFYDMSYSVEIFDEENAKYNKGSMNNDFGNIKEYKIAPFARYIVKKGSSSTYNATIPTTVPDASQIGTSSDTKGGAIGEWNIYNSYWDGKTATDKPYFLFPRSTRQADEVDKKEAQRVENILVKDLNKTLKWITEQVGWNVSDENQRVKDFFELTGKLANIKETGKFDFKGHTFEAQWQNQTNKSGTLTLTDKTTGDKLEKLYYQINTYKDVADKNEYHSRSGVSIDSKLAKLNWNQVVYYGNASYIATGLNSMNQSYQINSTDASLFERLLADLINTFVDGINTFLGAERFEKLMLSDTEKYDWHGVAPSEWFDVSGVFFWISQILSWLVLLGAVVKLFTSNLIESANTYARVHLMEGLKDILIAAFMLSFIYPIFELLATFNELFVDIVKNLTYSNAEMLESGGIMSLIAADNGLAAAILGLIYLGFNLYFNALFILRGAVVCLLFGIAPAFTVIYAFGGRFKSLTLRFYREVIGNIFIGSFYAIAVTFYGLFTLQNGGLLVSFALLWGFIPMTRLFKQLTGIGESDLVKETAATAQNKVSGAGKQHIKDPASRMTKGVAEGAYTAYKANSNMKVKRAELKSDVAEMRANGKDCRLSDYQNNSFKQIGGVALRGVSDAMRSRSLQKISNDMINNSVSAGSILENKRGGTIEIENSQKGAGYSGTVINDKGNYAHSFDKGQLESEGILNTRMSNNNGRVEQTYSADFVNKNKALFDKIESGTKRDGIVTDKKLKSQGVDGFNRHEDGRVTVSYNAHLNDVKNVRNDGGKIIVERGSSTTMATATLTDQLSLDALGEAKKKEDNKKDSK